MNTMFRYQTPTRHALLAAQKLALSLYRCIVMDRSCAKMVEPIKMLFGCLLEGTIY